MVIKDEVRKYIKKDAVASINSDGLMGDKVLTITSGKNYYIVNDQVILDLKSREMDDLMVKS
jgi:phospholipid/cholesterol/gamma-HCH transport system substrate-binding protein